MRRQAGRYFFRQWFMQIPYSVLQAAREWFFRQACSASRHILQSFDCSARAAVLGPYVARNNTNMTRMALMTASYQG